MRNSFLLTAILSCALGILSFANAATIAHWTFNDSDLGAADGVIMPDSGAKSGWATAAYDHSGNGNHLTTWNSNWHTWSAESYQGDFSIYDNNDWPAAFTWSDANPDITGTDLESWSSETWTVEALFMAETSDSTARTITGRDGGSVATAEGDNALAPFYLQIINNTIKAIATTASGDTYEVISADVITTGQWYCAAAVCDGSTLKLYLDGVDAGAAVTKNGTTITGATYADMSSSSTTAIAINNDSNKSSNWSVCRGYWNGGDTDRFYGYIDEVRISDTALTPAEFIVAQTLIINSLTSSVQTATPGDSVILTIDAINAATGDTTGLSFQWYKADGTLIDGAAAMEYETIAAQGVTDNSYYCVVTLDEESITSDTITITVSGLIAHWKFDANTEDSSDNELDATAAGAPAYTTGVNSQAVIMDGDDDYIILPATGLYQFPGGVTLSAWVNISYLPENGSVIEITDTDHANGMLISKYQDSSNLIVKIIDNGSTKTIRVTGGIALGQWQLYTLTIDADGNAIFYIDGAIAATQATGLPGAAAKDASTIGSSDAGLMTGMIDEVYIYSYALDRDSIINDIWLSSKDSYCEPGFDSEFDFDNNCRIDLEDFAIFAASWLDCEDCAGNENETLAPGYIFSYFTGESDGLHLAYSYDGLTWTALFDNESILAPNVGGGLMRDPSISRGPDGMFHMVWTSAWYDDGIGIAHSADLVNWSEQEYLTVMKDYDDVYNCWAPEIFYDEANDKFIIFWASTIPGAFEETYNASDDNNHRMYYTETSDFVTYSDTTLFYDPGFNCIDAFIGKNPDGTHVMFIKNETKVPTAEKNIRVALSDDADGPYGAASEAITGSWVEGPTALYINGEWIVYFDKYTSGTYGAVKSSDLENWTDISDQISFPSGARHGTTFKVSGEFFNYILNWK